MQSRLDVFEVGSFHAVVHKISPHEGSPKLDIVTRRIFRAESKLTHEAIRSGPIKTNEKPLSCLSMMLPKRIPACLAAVLFILSIDYCSAQDTINFFLNDEFEFTSKAKAYCNCVATMDLNNLKFTSPVVCNYPMAA